MYVELYQRSGLGSEPEGVSTGGSSIDLLDEASVWFWFWDTTLILGSGSGSGVDPELFELTTAKLDSGGSGSRVADAFARLMSTMEKTSTSTRWVGGPGRAGPGGPDPAPSRSEVQFCLVSNRKPRKDENLSEEAAKVIAALPDLSFMQAKVLMFPATLTPLSSQAAAD